MQDYLIKYREKHPTNAGVMVCGLPDSGLVAKIAVDHLIEQLKPADLSDFAKKNMLDINRTTTALATAKGGAR